MTHQTTRGDGPQVLRLLLVLLLLGSLFALTGVRQLMLDPIGNVNINLFWFGLQVAPILALLPFVIRGRRNGFVYCALASLFYFVHGVMLTGDQELQKVGLLEVGFALTLTGISSIAAKHAPLE